MDDRKILLDAICQDPDEGAPQLMSADLVGGDGDPDRAAFDQRHAG